MIARASSSRRSGFLTAALLLVAFAALRVDELFSPAVEIRRKVSRWFKAVKAPPIRALD